MLPLHHSTCRSRLIALIDSPSYFESTNHYPLVRFTGSWLQHSGFLRLHRHRHRQQSIQASTDERGSDTNRKTAPPVPDRR